MPDSANFVLSNRSDSDGSRLLVTTALQETWGNGEPLVLLGEWCRVRALRHLWQIPGATVLPYRWDDLNTRASDYTEIAHRYENALDRLAALLNVHHGLSWSTRAWRILLGPWLFQLVTIAYDRYAAVGAATASGLATHSIVLDAEPEATIPHSSLGFLRFAVTDEWNHVAFASILEAAGTFDIRHKDGTELTRRLRAIGADTSGSGSSLRNGLHCALARLASLAPFRQRILFTSTGFAAIDQVRLSLAIGQLPVPVLQLTVPSVPPTEGLRREFASVWNARNPFEKLLARFVFQFMPTAYLEGFGALRQAARILPGRERTQATVTANAHAFDDVYKAWMAERLGDGLKIAIHQHGGHYGSGRWTQWEDHERKIADRYLTWGWGEGVESLERVPSSRLVHMRVAGSARRRVGHILMVLTTLPRYAYLLQSMPIAGQYALYLEEQARLISALRGAARKAVKIRPYPEDFGWNCLERLRDAVGSISLDDTFAPIELVLGRALMVVATANTTTFLEALAANVPTVAFLNPSHWPVREASCDDFERLREASILHDTPESAAALIDRVFDNVDSWWHGAKVQEARAAFVARYAVRSQDWPAQWAAALGRLTAPSGGARGRER